MKKLAMDKYPRSPNAGSRSAKRPPRIPPASNRFLRPIGLSDIKKITGFSLGRGKEFETGELLGGGTGPRIRAICLAFLKEKEQ
jgi:hypothetical protein